MNNFSMKNSAGYTLVELLVVIAIIGILSTVVLTSLSSARMKARVAAVQEQMHGLQTAANQCITDVVTLNLPAEANDGGAGPICAGSVASYSVLPAGWIYCNGVTTEVQGISGCGNDVSAATGITFTLSAESNADGQFVTCTESTCSTVADSD